MDRHYDALVARRIYVTEFRRLVSAEHIAWLDRVLKQSRKAFAMSDYDMKGPKEEKELRDTMLDSVFRRIPRQTSWNISQKQWIDGITHYIAVGLNKGAYHRTHAYRPRWSVLG